MAPRRGPSAPPAIHTEAAATFRRRLHRWYRRHSRDLPWRRTRDPYRILISELMLQQTQVSRVLDFYARFLDRFPDLSALASAKPHRVLEAWEGLGYYARARNLHKLAREVTEERAGVIPSDPVQLRALPGIGAYTAGAVASFAYEKRAALVDTNVARVLHRVFAPKSHPNQAPDSNDSGRSPNNCCPAPVSPPGCTIRPSWNLVPSYARPALPGVACAPCAPTARAGSDSSRSDRMKCLARSCNAGRRRTTSRRDSARGHRHTLAGIRVRLHRSAE